MSRKTAIALCLAALALAGPPRPAQAAACDQHLKTIGAVSAGYLLVTFNYIGAVADGLVKNAYAEANVKEMMLETIDTLNYAREQIAALKAEGLSDQDRKVIDRMLEALDLLKKEAGALRDFAGTRSAADAEKFDAIRLEALYKIKKLGEK